MRVATALACAALALAAMPARAENFSAALEAGSERDADDFSKAVLNYDIASVTRSFDNGMSWTALVQNYRATRHGAVTWAVEGLVGYRYAATPSFSFYANIGGGERLSPTRDFPYLALRLGADHALGGDFTWNVVNLRYRTGWDKQFPYHSTAAGTGITYRMSSAFALYSRVFAMFDTNYRFAATGIGLGLRTYF